MYHLLRRYEALSKSKNGKKERKTKEWGNLKIK